MCKRHQSTLKNETWGERASMITNWCYEICLHESDPRVALANATVQEFPNELRQ